MRPETESRKARRAAERSTVEGGPLTVFYDGDCGMCSGAVAWALQRDRDRLLNPIPYQSPRALEYLGLEGVARAAEELHVWSESYGMRTGADAVVDLLTRLPGWRWLGRLFASRALRPMVQQAYRSLAARREWFGAPRCQLPERSEP